MNPLTITEAHKLFSIIEKYLPDKMDGGTNFIKVLIDNMNEWDDGTDFIQILAILNQVDSDTIIRDLEPKDGIFVLLQGFEINKLSEMITFFKGLRHA